MSATSSCTPGMVENSCSTPPIFTEVICPEGNPHVNIGNENYMLSADGMLMPAKKNQAPPDLRYFKPTQK